MHDTVPAEKWVTMARRLIAIAAAHDEPQPREESRPSDRAADGGDSASGPVTEPAASATSGAAPRRRHAAVRTARPAAPRSAAPRSAAAKSPSRKTSARKTVARKRRVSAES